MSESIIKPKRPTGEGWRRVKQLRTELAASREREAQMREALWQLLDDMGETGLCVCVAAKEQAKAALAEGAQEPVHRPVHGELNNEA